MKQNKYNNILILGACILFTAFGLEFITRAEISESREYKERIDSVYNSILQDDLSDSNYINLLNKYTPLKDKERVVDENSLEKSLK